MSASGLRAGTPSLLTGRRVDRVRVEVGFRAQPDGEAHEHLLLDLPVPEDGPPPDEERYLTLLEPVLDAGGGRTRHHSLHVHRWHTSWGVATGALDLGLTVTTGTGTPTGAGAAPTAYDATLDAFRALLELGGPPTSAPIDRATAVASARRSVAAASGLAADELTLFSEEHHTALGTWTVGVRAGHTERFLVDVGVVDGYAGSVRVRHEPAAEVADSLGSE
jgi:hypothetical protein